MKISKTPIATESILSVSFENETGIIAVSSELAAPLKSKLVLACRLTRDEARELSAALLEFANGA